MYDAISTGSPELDQLINTPSILRETVPLHKPDNCKGFPLGRITVLDGPNADAAVTYLKEQLQGTGALFLDATPDEFTAEQQLVFAPAPTEPPGPDNVYARVTLAIQKTKTALVWYRSTEIPKVLKYYAFIRLRFEGDTVRIIKTMVSTNQGDSMEWPPG